MVEIIVKAFSFLIIIILGHVLKRKGIFNQSHGRFLATVIMNITLPCVLIMSMNTIDLKPLLLIAMLFGFIVNVIAMIVVERTSKGFDQTSKALAMINTPGYNIGTFALPFVQSFFPLSAIAYVILFDVGSAIMGLGGTFAYASIKLATGEKMTWKMIGRNLLASIPFDVYMILFVLTVFKIQVPKTVITLVSIPGNANAFLSMLMIGIILEVKLDFDHLKLIRKILINRYCLTMIFIMVVYLLLPVDLIFKKMLTLCLLAPVPSVAPVFSRKISDSPVPAAVNSISMIISIGLMTLFIVLTSI